LLPPENFGTKFGANLMRASQRCCGKFLGRSCVPCFPGWHQTLRLPQVLEPLIFRQFLEKNGSQIFHVLKFGDKMLRATARAHAAKGDNFTDQILARLPEHTGFLGCCCGAARLAVVKFWCSNFWVASKFWDGQNSGSEPGFLPPCCGQVSEN